MEHEKNNTLLIAAVVVGLLWLYGRRPLSNIPSYSSGLGGTRFNIPGVGAYSNTPLGTSFVLDPRLFGGLTGTTSGAGQFNPGSGVLSPLLPNTGGGAAAGAAAGGDVMQTGDGSGNILLGPQQVIPPEYPGQVPVDPSMGGGDPGVDPNLIPSMVPDPSTLDPGAVPQLFDPGAFMAL
jgi:hypothetical protein